MGEKIPIIYSLGENEFEKYLIPIGMLCHFTMEERKAYYDDLKKNNTS